MNLQINNFKIKIREQAVPIATALFFLGLAVGITISGTGYIEIAPTHNNTQVGTPNDTGNTSTIPACFPDTNSTTENSTDEFENLSSLACTAPQHSGNSSD